MEHRNIKWPIAILLTISFLFLIIGWLGIFEKNMFLSILILPFIITIGKFCLTPLLTATGIYQYHSAMLLTLSQGKNELEIHSGTLFDYWRVMRKIRSSLERKIILMRLYADGILNIIESIESGRISPKANIGFSTYSLESTVVRYLNLPVKKAGFLVHLNFIINYPEMLIFSSLSKGKVSFPKISQLYTCNLTGSELLERKEKIKLIHSIKRS